MGGVSLRPYQTRCIDEARARFAEGARSVLITMPTGGGKSTVAASVAKGHHDLGGTVLAVVHRVELVEQLAQRFRQFGLPTGEIRPGAPASAARVQVASIQTLLARQAAPTASLILWDEAHHVLATTWSRLIQPQALLVGLTATPMLATGDGLGAAFQSMVVAATREELRASGVLVPCEVIAPDRELGPGELAQDPVDAYLAHAPGEQAVLFAPSVALAREYAASFEARGVSAVAVTGDLSPTDRASVMARFRSGEARVLSGVMVATEGFDHPPASVCILARRVGHLGLYDQMVGRVLRSSPGKTRAVLLDLTGATHLCGPPDEERRFSLTGRGLRRAQDLPDVRFCPVCGSTVTEPPCTECGHAGELRQRRPRVLGLPMTRFERIRRDDDEARALRYSRWLRHAEARGYRPGHAKHRYAAVYGAPPSLHVARRARELITG